MGIDIFRILDVLDGDVRHHLVIGLNVDQVLDGPPLGRPGAFRHLEDAHPETAALLREDEQPIVVGRREDLLDEILITGDGPLGPHPTTGLFLVFVEAGPLDVAGVADGDHHLLVRNHVLDAQLGAGELNAGTALVAKLLLDLEQLVLDDGHPQPLVLENGLQSTNQLHQFIVLCTELVPLESGQLLEAHVENGPRLQLAQLELLHQAVAGFFRRLAATDERDDFIEVVNGDDQALQDVGALFGLPQLKLRAADHNIMAVLDVMEDHLPQVQELRTALDQGDVVDREAGLELRVLVELVEHHVGNRVALQVEHDPQPLPVRLIADFADALNLLLIDEVRRLAHHVRLVDLVGNLLDDDLLLSGPGLFETRLAAHDHATAAGLIGILDAFHSVDDSAGGEVGRLDVLHEPLHRNVGVVDHGDATVHHLSEVVRRHVGGHADRDTGGSIDEQVGNLGREHRGLLQAVVKVVGEVNGLLVEVGEHFLGDLPETGLGVSHGGGVVPVDGTEVSLTIHHRIAHGPVLSKADHGVVHGAVSVRMVLTEHLPHDTGGFLVSPVGQDAQFEHAEQHTPVNRLQSIPHIGEGTRYDDRHRVIDVGRLHLILNRNRNDLLSFCHVVIALQAAVCGPKWASSENTT